MFRRILLVPSAATSGLDQPAVRRLLSLARRGTKVEVFEPAYDGHLEGYLGHKELYQPLRERVVREHQERVATLARQLKTSHHLTSKGTAAWDHPRHAAVVRRALEIHAELVIVEPQAGRSGALGQSDWRLISSCPMPVLVVKSDGTQKYRNIVAAVDPFHSHSKPLGLDEAIIACAASVRTLTKAALKVVHGFAPLVQAGAVIEAEYLPIDQVETALEADRRAQLGELLRRARLPASRGAFLTGRPDAILQRLAQQREADLIVMGALSRGFLKDLLIGSTAERVLSHSSVDVLLVKPPGFKTPVRARA